jgi:uncharacterized protein YciI
MIHGPGWDPDRGIREQEDWETHAAFMDELAESGFVMMGGPIGDDGALLLVEAQDETEIRSCMSEDPWARSRLLQIGVIEPWEIWLRGRPGLS